MAKFSIFLKTHFFLNTLYIYDIARFNRPDVRKSLFNRSRPTNKINNNDDDDDDDNNDADEDNNNADDDDDDEKEKSTNSPTDAGEDDLRKEGKNADEDIR